MSDRYGIEAKHTSVLKELYAKYLVNVRHVGKTTIKHYLDALKYVSKALADKGLIDSDNTIYDVDDVDKLISIRDALLADSEFIALNKRGHGMYRVGLIGGAGVSPVKIEVILQKGKHSLINAMK